MRWFRIWILPGAVFQSLIVGGGYGTGREVVEFISRHGALGGLGAVALVGILWGAVLAITFELARRFRLRDYRSFFKLMLGRFWFLYELFFVAALLLVLAVCGAAAGEVLEDAFGIPGMIGIALMLVLVGALNYAGRGLVEKTLSGWGIAMSVVLLVFVILALADRGAAVAEAFGQARLGSGWALSGFQFFLYNVGAAPAILFATGHLETPRQAVGAGLVGGLLGVLPGLAFHIAFMGAWPHIVEQPLPTYWLLQELDLAWLRAIYVVLLFGTIAQTGVGLLQGLNERLDAWRVERGRPPLSPRVHAAIAMGAVGASLLLANVGIVGLVAQGYGTLAWFSFAVYVVPLATLGLARLLRRPAPPGTSGP